MRRFLIMSCAICANAFLSGPIEAEISTPGLFSRPYYQGHVQNVDEFGIMHGEFFDTTGLIRVTRIRNFYMDVDPTALAELVTGAHIGCRDMYTDADAMAATCFMISNDGPFRKTLDIDEQLKDKDVKLGCNYWDRRAESNGIIPLGIMCN